MIPARGALRVNKQILRPMKIPKTIKIGGHLISIDQNQEIEDAAGDWNARKNLIRIDKHLPMSQKEATLIHEIFHAMNYTFADEPVAHALLESLSEQWYQVLSDNDMLK